jgi:large subunit ribosomal protein L31
MRQGIHPKYFEQAKVTCSCGATWTTGSTQEMIRTDVCSSCHPFFTGEQRIVDSAGQVDRFMKRLGQYDKHQVQAATRQAQTHKKLEQRFLRQQVIALDLSSEMYEILHSVNIITVGDLIHKLETDQAGLLALEGIGPKSVEEARTKLVEARATYFAEAH